MARIIPPIVILNTLTKICLKFPHYINWLGMFLWHFSTSNTYPLKKISHSWATWPSNNVPTPILEQLPPTYYVSRLVFYTKWFCWDYNSQLTDNKSRQLILSLKVSKFRKQIFLFSFEPKNERNYFWFLP